MTGRIKRLAIAIVLTIVDIAACNYYCGVIWQKFAGDFFAKVTLLGLLFLGIATALVIWLHVAYDFRQILRELDARLAVSTATSTSEFRSDINV